MVRRIVCMILIMVAIIGAVNADSVIVTANRLNGRMTPSKKGIITALFDRGDSLPLTGRDSKDHKWIEVEGGEAGTAWVYYEYVTERLEAFTVKNEDYKAIKIRKKPCNGKITGYLKKGKTLIIDRVLLGWGHCSKGWIDLSLVTEFEGR